MSEQGGEKRRQAHTQDGDHGRTASHYNLCAAGKHGDTYPTEFESDFEPQSEPDFWLTHSANCEAEAELAADLLYDQDENFNDYYMETDGLGEDAYWY